MNPNAVLGVVSTYAFCLPVFLIVIFRLHVYKPFFALLIYFLLATVSNLMTEGVVPATEQVRKIFGVVYNLLDLPLMLTGLLLFCGSRQKVKNICVTIVVFLLYEVVVLWWHGFTRQTVTYVLGPGIVVILAYSVHLFVQYVKLAVVHEKAIGKALMIGAVCFTYGSYAMIYVFYYVAETPAVAEVFILYYVASIVSAVLLSVGITLVQKRMRLLREARLTRKELHMFFNA